jgi:hypothetical protein
MKMTSRPRQNVMIDRLTQRNCLIPIVCLFVYVVYVIAVVDGVLTVLFC